MVRAPSRELFSARTCCDFAGDFGFGGQPPDGEDGGEDGGGGEAKSRFSAAKRRFSGAAAKPKPAPPKGEKPRKSSLGVGRRRGTKT